MPDLADISAIVELYWGFKLFTDAAPKTAENFRVLCTGEKGVGPKLRKPLHYKGTFFHRIVKGFMAQGGDLLRKEGSAGESIYGDRFPDESPKLKHDEAGLLSMSIADRDVRGSIFSLLFKANQNLDRKNIVFGKLVHGHEVLKKIEDAGDEDGSPAVTVKVCNSGELSKSEKKKLGKKLGKEAGSDAYSHETRRKGKHKKSLRDRRKKRRKYYTSESDDVSSSSDDRRKKRKKSSKRDKYKRGKRRDRRRDKKRKRHDKRSKRKSRRASDSLSDTDSESIEESSEDEGNGKDFNQKHKDDLQKNAEDHPPVVENASIVNNHKRSEESDKFDEELRSKTENGEQRSNGYDKDARSGRNEDRQPDVVEDHLGKSRSTINSSYISSLYAYRFLLSPPPAVQKSRSVSRSPVRSASRSPGRSLSRSPARSLSKTPASSLSRSPPRIRPRRNASVSPVTSPPRRSPSGSYRGGSSQKSIGRSPGRVGRRSSPSPVRSRRSVSPVRSSHRSLSRSSGRAPSRRVASRSPVRSPRRSYRRSYSRSPGRRSPPIRHRSISRSASPDGSPKRIRRGRGFSDRFSYARKYRTPSPDRYRFGGRDRYPSYRRYSDRSPRRFRSPRRSPIRYRRRRSRTRSPSVSRSPPYRRRYTRSPIRSRSPSDPPRYRASPRAEKRLSSSRSRSRSASASGSSKGSPPPKRASKDRSQSRSSSGSPPGKKGLVSYGDGSAEASPR
uniref:peptidylprolyl isomerase n=1 Tax=Chenopodium quinoa TaxID=63459 RepID=A0A803MJT1_CHEQI